MKNHRFQWLHFAAILLCTGVLASCSSSTSPTNSNTNNNNNGGGGGTGPSVGSTFNFVVTGEDTTGTAIPGQVGTETLTIVNVVPTLLGKSNVYLETPTTNLQVSTGGEFAFETNGDVSQYSVIAADPNGGQGLIRWVTLPFGSHQTQTIYLDTSFLNTFLNTHDTIVYSATISYVGTGTDNVNGVAVPVEIVKFVEHAYSATIAEETDDITIIYDYAPTLKQFTHQTNTERVNNSFQGYSAGIIDFALASYTVK
jgi:hypothetical protein